MTRGRGRTAFLLALTGLVLAWAIAFPAWPDDWDGLGFLASIARFDLVSFAPHAPGYPVYVACLKVAAWGGSSPIGAARIVGVGAGAVTFGGLYVATPEGRDGLRSAAAAGACALPLMFHAFSGVGSEGPALACAAVALAGVAGQGAREGGDGGQRRAWLVGLAVGLGLGVRLSWGPFYVPFLLLLPTRNLRLRALLGAALAVVAWAVPLVLVTGPSRLVALYRTQAGGHFGRWGNTAVTDPVRARFLGRDVVADGFGGGTDVLGIAVLLALLLVVAIAVAVARDAEPTARLRTGRRALLLVAPYLAWVVLGQNLREQPRHVLPLVFVAAYALAYAFLRSSARLRPAFALLVVLVVARTSQDAYARRTIPPQGAQLLAYLRAEAPLATTAVFAGASARFLDGTEWQPRIHPAGTLGDALLAVTHFDRIPVPLLLTSELSALDEAPRPLIRVRSFCRPARLDRRTTCLHLYALEGKAASKR